MGVSVTMRYQHCSVASGEPLTQTVDSYSVIADGDVAVLKAHALRLKFVDVVRAAVVNAMVSPLEASAATIVSLIGEATAALPGAGMCVYVCRCLSALSQACFLLEQTHPHVNSRRSVPRVS